MSKQLQELARRADVEKAAPRRHRNLELRKASEQKTRELLVDVAGNRQRPHLHRRRPVNVHDAGINKEPPTRYLRLLQKTLHPRWRSALLGLGHVHPMALCLPGTVGIGDAGHTLRGKTDSLGVQPRHHVTTADNYARRRRQRIHRVHDVVEHRASVRHRHECLAHRRIGRSALGVPAGMANEHSPGANVLPREDPEHVHSRAQGTNPAVAGIGDDNEALAPTQLRAISFRLGAVGGSDNDEIKHMSELYHISPQAYERN